METFKVGDHVCVKDDFIEGKIVEIQGETAFVEFRTNCGGGCLSFAFSELEHIKWWITTKHPLSDEICYLGWNSPVWNGYDYFWIGKKELQEIIANNTLDRSYLFNSRRAAIKHLKSIDIPQKCKVIRWN